MSRPWASLQRLFADAGAIAVDRALAEFRAGRPVILEGPGTRVMAAAIDDVSPAVFEVGTQKLLTDFGVLIVYRG